MTEPDWDHPPVSAGRFLALLALGLPGVVAAAQAPRHVWASPGADLSPDALPWTGPGPALILVAVAVAAGLYAAPRAGFNSRIQDRTNYGTEILPGLRSDLGPAILGGAALGLLLAAASRWAAGAPPPYGASADPLAAGLPVRLLHGALTEEVVLRWGLTSAAALALTVAVHRRRDDPGEPVLAAAVVASALVVGLGHLAAAGALGPSPDRLVAWSAGADALAGLVLGTVFWRRSLEAAMVAHGLAHVVLAAALASPLPA